MINNQFDLSQRLESIEVLRTNDILQNCSNNKMSLNDITVCSLPINNITDLHTFNDKISDDGEFKMNLVNIFFL